MHADDVRTVKNCGDTRRQRAFQPLVDREVQHLSDERLARGADENGTAEGGEPREAGNELQVVLEPFPEANPRIDQDLPDDRLSSPGKCTSEYSDDLAKQVVVCRVALHGFGSPFDVHDDRRGSSLANHLRHRGIE